MSDDKRKILQRREFVKGQDPTEWEEVENPTEFEENLIQTMGELGVTSFSTRQYGYRLHDAPGPKWRMFDVYEDGTLEPLTGVGSDQPLYSALAALHRSLDEDGTIRVKVTAESLAVEFLVEPL